MGWNPILDIFKGMQKKYPTLAKRMAEAEALGRWDAAVGPAIAKHARAVHVQDGVLWIEVDHPIWKSELHHRKRQILDNLNKSPAEGTTPIRDLLLLEPRSPGNRNRS